MDTTISTISSDGVEGVESLTRKCCLSLNLGECPEWIDGLETGATEVVGATPAQQAETPRQTAKQIADAARWLARKLDATECLYQESKELHEAACDEAVALRSRVAELESVNGYVSDILCEASTYNETLKARVATLEAECVAWRVEHEESHNDDCSDEGWARWRETERARDAARAATGPIGGVA